MNNTVKIGILMAIVSIALTSCEILGDLLSSEANFTSFSFAGMDGSATIDQAGNTITAKALATTDLKTIAPVFSVSAGAKVTVGGVEQESGITQNNFTNPVVYRVTSSDGTNVQNWTVSITKDTPTGTVTELTNTVINASPNVTLPAGIYQVKSDLTLTGGNTLTIQAGSEIRFDQNRRLTTQVNAKIIAKGTSSKKITFTSSVQTPAAGAWTGVYLYGVNNEFDWCVFEYGGGQSNGWGMLYLDNATASITNCTFRNSKYSAIYLYRADSRFNKFENNTMTNCGETEAESYPIKVGSSANLICLGDMGTNTITTTKGIGVNSGTVNRNVTIKAFVPYLFYGDQTFNNAAVVTVEPGATLKFEGSRRITLEADAKLIANGTTAQIKFTSSRTAPEAGDWHGIYIINSNDSEFKNCVFEYGGGQSSGWGMLYLDNCKASITNCIIRHAKYNGIYLYRDKSGFTAFDNNTITDCGENQTDSYPVRAGSSAGLMSLAVMGDNNTITSAKGIGVTMGTVNGNLTLKKYLYTIDVDIAVSNSSSNATLTISPGAYLMFTSGRRLSVGTGGKLVANGEATNKITFTGTNKEKGWWYGIIFDNKNALSGSKLTHCNISYGGRGTGRGNNGNISCYDIASGILEVNNCEISYSRAWGIHVSNNAYPTIGNTINYSNNGQNNNSNLGDERSGAQVIGTY